MSTDFREMLSLIKELQKIDLDLHNFARTMDEFPERMKVEQSSYDEIKSHLESVKSELSEVEHEKRTHESELAESTEYLRNREAKLYAIKTNKEYQAAIKEVSDGKKINREREDLILKAMERIEELKKSIEELEVQFAEKQKALDLKKSEFAEEEQKLRDEFSSYEKRRPEIVAKLDKKLMKRYDFVQRRYVDAVVAVKDNACQGCLRRIPPQMINEMMRFEELKSCPHCQRLLYLYEGGNDDSNDEESMEKD